MTPHATYPATQFRIARPTHQLDAVVAFYTEGLGLPLLYRFEAHAGYRGAMIGLPGVGHHLEFTEHDDGAPCPAPSKDNLLVLYFPGRQELDVISRRLEDHGVRPVAPENPYWEKKGLTFEDPDGWRVVLFEGSFGGGGRST
ncbi:VOC family protein [Flaviaesturariibacter amylovorans]|uniref:VOC family protein n=1 Tax=Flaviaesturariibacter amylovorans TaxID=1084520 RepID=A0ABP8HR70_9BACT